MTRRDLLRTMASGLGLAWLPRSGHGRHTAVSLPPVHPDDDRPPIWTPGKWWERVAVADTLVKPFEDEAVKLGPGDPRPTANVYTLQLMSEKLLHGHGGHLIGLIEAACRYDTASDWPAQKKWLGPVFQSYYQPDRECPAWCSIVTARRPSHLHKERPRGHYNVNVEQSLARRIYLHPEDNPTRYVGLPLEGIRWAYPANTPEQKTRLAMVTVPRWVTCDHFRIREPYEEIWFCRAREREDDARLIKGRIPAVPDSHYKDNLLRVRDTVIINLVKLTRDLWYSFHAIELHPSSAGVLSIRRCNMPLAASFLRASPIEYVGAAKMLGG